MCLLTRRQLVTRSIWSVFGLSPILAQAESKPVTIDVVKLLSFSCPVCAASETQDMAISKAVRNLGGKYVKAPVVSVKGDTGFQAKIYYASRQWGFEFSEQISASLYRASQEGGIPLLDSVAVYTWLQQDSKINLEESRLQAMMKDANSSDVEQSFIRALLIARDIGANALPCYAFLHGSDILTMVDPVSNPGGPGQLREGVIKKLDELYKRFNPT